MLLYDPHYLELLCFVVLNEKGPTKVRGQSELLCGENLAAASCAAAGVAFQAGTIADKCEVLTLRAGFTLISLHTGLLYAFGNNRACC